MACSRPAALSWLPLPSFTSDSNSGCFIKKVVVVSVAGICLHFAVKKYLAKSRENRRSQYKKDVVILHQFKRGTTLPSISAYVLKLETYLRVANIPYESDFEEPFGPKGKSPWITYNGVDVADSTFCIQYLNKQLSINLNSKLTEEQIAVSRCLMLATENSFGFCAALWRCVYDKELSILKLSPTLPFILRLFPSIMKRYVKKIGFYQGIGRHSEEEVYDIAMQDLEALSDYLGKKPFFMGNEATEVDCALFGMLAQCIWAMPNSPFEAALNGELTNLKDFCLRMKNEFWKDWDSILMKK